jgi:hypothetical protein
LDEPAQKLVSAGRDVPDAIEDALACVADALAILDAPG